MASRKVPAIGIDLGTWKCCVGVVREGKVEIIANERGSKTTPSYVAFTETERLVGEDAKDQVALNPTNTVFGVKRIIGRTFDDPVSQHHLKNSPFKTKQIDGQSEGDIEILVRYKGTDKWLLPEHITTMLLRKMKLTAEEYLGCPVQEAVVSVPACFNSSQRQATLEAAEVAGLKVLQLLHEPTAVALAYKDHVGHITSKQTVMVVDLEGGLLEVSIASIKENTVQVLATSSDERLGGLDLDQLLLDDYVKNFQFGKDGDLNKNIKALERLRIACQKVKYSLALSPDTVIVVDSLADGRDLKRQISREQFPQFYSERINEKINEILNGVLKGINLTMRDIDEVIVVGGSTRVPLLLQILHAYAGKKLNTSVNADEAVAHGAALQAALLAEENTLADTRIIDVSPRNFILEHEQSSWFIKKRGVLFHRNRSIPHERVWNVFVGREGKQTLHLYECNKDSNERSSLSTYTYNFELEKSWNPVRTVPVLFNIDENCLISLRPCLAEEYASIKVYQSPSNNANLTKIKKDEQCFQRYEHFEQEQVQAFSKLELSFIEFKDAVKNWKTQLEGQKYVKDLKEKCESILRACDNAVCWMDKKPNVDVVQFAQQFTLLEQRMYSMVDLMSSAPQSGADCDSSPANSTALSGTANTMSCLDGNGILQSTEMHKGSSDSSENANKPERNVSGEQYVIPPKSDQRPVQRKSQPVNGGTSSKKNITVALQQQGRLDKQNGRPEHSLTSTRHQQQQVSLPHVASQLNESCLIFIALSSC